MYLPFTAILIKLNPPKARTNYLKEVLWRLQWCFGIYGKRCKIGSFLGGTKVISTDSIETVRQAF